MNRLREKTFYTIFSIISIFVIVIIIFINIQNYQKECSSINSNLNRMNEVINPIDNTPPEKKPDDDLNNRIIMDYNFYTILLDRNNNIIDKISHNENEINNKILNEAINIIDNTRDREVKINCLYFSNIAYNFKPGDYLIIVDTSGIQQSLLTTLFISIILFIIFEIMIFYFAKKITNWITKPVEDSFNKQKDFIANASHELKTPLAVMIASIDCIDIDKKNEKYINNLKSESDRMNNLITRLLELSKSEQGTSEELKTMNNLSKVVQKRILVFESLAFENKVEIEEEIEKNIMFKCCQNDIDELLGILIDNAIKHSFKDSKVKVRLYSDNNTIIIEVINNGEEIPKEDYEKIFERFYRSDMARSRKTNRYGLGLSIAKNIVLNYNGEIKVSSENKHTVFKVFLKK